MASNDSFDDATKREVISLKRRSVLRSASAAAGVMATGLSGGLIANSAQAVAIGTTSSTRSNRALIKRVDRALVNMSRQVSKQTTNSDESTIANFAGNYSKGLPHDAVGEVSLPAYRALRRACSTNTEADWAAVPMGGAARQISPQAAFSYQMEGSDSALLRMAEPPGFSSEQRGAEMVELYWMALLRDVPFAQYPSNALAAEAVNDLRRFTLFRDVTTATLFRGLTVGEKIGPYVSQFLLRDVPFGAATIVQRYVSGAKDVNFMTTLSECVSIQNGVAPMRPLTLDAPHFMRSGRDLGEYVHTDFSYQAFLNAALIALRLGPTALDDANPYKGYTNRVGFVDFGGPDILSMVAQVAVLALKAAWYQKWAVHRTLRPEAFGLRVHQKTVGARNYLIHNTLFSSPALSKTNAANGSFLLPMAYAEGSPNHPAFPSGHATIAGACVTVLKAFFKESHVLTGNIEASFDGATTVPYNGVALTLGGELDKLAANVAIGRNIAGVHYWSDAIEGMNLGEKVGLAFLSDLRGNYGSTFAGFSLTKFDGSSASI